MKLHNNSILPAPSEERIESFQDYCGIKLPKEFIDFIKKSNGAIPKTNVFSHEGKEYLIERFLCLI